MKRPRKIITDLNKATRVEPPAPQAPVGRLPRIPGSPTFVHTGTTKDEYWIARGDGAFYVLCAVETPDGDSRIDVVATESKYTNARVVLLKQARNIARWDSKADIVGEFSRDTFLRRRGPSRELVYVALRWHPTEYTRFKIVTAGAIGDYERTIFETETHLAAKERYELIVKGYESLYQRVPHR